MNLGIQPRDQGNERSDYNKLQVRLKGKKGRFRNLSSENNDSHNKSFAFDSVTIFDTVNALNIDQLQERVKKGPKNVGGAKSVIDLDGKKIFLEDLEDCSMIVVEAGFRVERYLYDGEIIVLHRQPWKIDS